MFQFEYEINVVIGVMYLIEEMKGEKEKGEVWRGGIMIGERKEISFKPSLEICSTFVFILLSNF